MLRVRATDAELDVLRAALDWVAESSPRAFAALFDPDGPPSSMPTPPAPIHQALAAFGLVADGGHGIVGTHRIVRRDRRYYVLELGLGDGEYRHDLWPESEALVAALDGAPPGRVLDVGCGYGLVAIEAAARGRDVVAVDRYAPSLELARFNARLNRVRVDFRQGELLAPVAGERFALILAAPHYGGVDDQHRLEVLRAAPAHLEERGRLVVATHAEWQRDKLGLGCELEPLSRRGYDVRVVPLESPRKRDWFHVPTPEMPMPGLVSRHRFVITVDAGAPARFDVTWPATPYARDLVPLARLKKPGADVAVVYPDDVIDLAWFCLQVREPRFVIDVPLPAGWLDACRWGGAHCVDEEGGAAGAIVDARGGVRPCTHGDLVARSSDSVEGVHKRLRVLADAARARRGCDACIAVAHCSTCLFPFPLDETAYCEFMRLHHVVLDDVRRLFATGQTLDRLGVAPGALRVTRLGQVPPQWPMAETWVVERGARSFVFWRERATLRQVECEPTTARELESFA